MPRKVPPEKLHLNSLRKSLALIQQELDGGSKDMDLIQQQSTIIRQIGQIERRLEKAREAKPVDECPYPLKQEGSGGDRAATYTVNGEIIRLFLPADAPKGYLSRQTLYQLTKLQLTDRLAEMQQRKARPRVCLDCEQPKDECICKPIPAPALPHSKPQNTLEAVQRPLKPNEAPKTPPDNSLELVAGARELIRLMEIKYNAFLRFSNPFIGGQFNEMQATLIPLLESLGREANGVYVELVGNRPWLFARLPVDNSRQLAFLEATQRMDRIRKMEENNRRERMEDPYFGHEWGV